MQTQQNIQHNFNPKQLKLPLQLDIKIPFDSEVRTFDEVFRKLEIKKYLNSSKDPRGRMGYNPVQMLKLIMFCQMEKIQSLRDMAKAAKNDIRIMWLTDELMPSHQTIKTFMDKYLVKGIDEIFYELSKYLIKKESIDTDKLYIDGTKIESVANKYSFTWRGSIEKFRDKLYKKITKQIDILNQRYKDSDIFFSIHEIYNTDYLSSIKDFLQKEINRETLEFKYGKGQRKTTLQRDYEHILEYLAKLVEYERHLKIMGNDRNSYAKTDIDATFMHMKEDHMRNSQLKPGYNIQIGVSNEYILHLDIYKERSDYKTLIPFLEGFKKSYDFYPKYPVADAGYGGLTNYRYLKLNDMELYQKYAMYAKDTHDKKRMKDPYFPFNLTKSGNDYLTPNGDTLKYLYRNNRGNDVYELPNGKRKEINDENLTYQKEVIKNLTSPLGIELRVQRSIQVEGAFGVIKEAFKVRRFRRRLTHNVKMEFYLTAIGYNLRKYHNKKYRITE
ncbi:Transposase, IS4-like [Alteracholeplasma palmae J233]|uniref:Transposase, IS4-like n=1 Tax=Alteracholeplasma palmae (strain ATCC 49389 / J233) TaxID=1318466 RepID=U4KQI2_ALTPJ|nr:transposase [Alteracholeplasma palmae]CCV64625.1 Transposase, IS4-like [Alteracholeplasma palmae J233]